MKKVTTFLTLTVASITLNALAQGFDMKAPALPDPNLTPGDALQVTAKDICVSGYSKKVRNVPQAVKEQVYHDYHIAHRAKGEYEVDHLISLELGGSNSTRNLWPESYETSPWNAHVKDKLENAFHKDICSRKIDIKDAQKQMASNWIVAYKKRFPDDPLVKIATPKAPVIIGAIPVNGPNSTVFPFAPVTPATPNPISADSKPQAGQVWVNTKSGVFWRVGTRYYGKTKEGKYMSEPDAIKARYHAAGGQ